MPVYDPKRSNILDKLESGVSSILPRLPPGLLPPTPRETGQAWKEVIEEAPTAEGTYLPFMPKVNLSKLGKAAYGTASAISSVPGLEFISPLTFAGPKAAGFAKAPRKFSSMADKMQRFEIGDMGFKFKKTKLELDKYGFPKEGSRTLGDIVDHPELFKQYPFAKDIKLQEKGEGSLTLGSKPSGGANYNPGTNTIEAHHLTDSAGYVDERTLRNIIHEIQHAIQEKEGFAKGGSPLESVMTRTEANSIMNQIEELNQLLSKNVGKPEYVQIMEERDRLSRYYRNSTPEKGYERYKNLAGEIEARDAAARMGLAEAQRATTLPYSSENIPLKDWIVK